MSLPSKAGEETASSSEEEDTTDEVTALASRACAGGCGGPVRVGVPLSTTTGETARRGEERGSEGV